MKLDWRNIYIIASISAGIFVTAYHLGREAGVEATTAKVNTVLDQQQRRNNIGGTWDAVAESLNGRP